MRPPRLAGWRRRPGSSRRWCTTTSRAWTNCSWRCCGQAPSQLHRQRDALSDDDPLHALWQLNNAHGAQLWMEFMALANHRKAIRSEIAAYAERFRDLEEATLALVLRAHGVDTPDFPPVVMSMIVASLARILVLEHGLGITRGHREAMAFIERMLNRYEMPSS